MKSTGFLIGVACLGISLLVLIIAQNTYWEEVSIPAPPSGEAVTNPFYGAQKLAEALGATTEWRHSLGTLPNTDGVIVLSNWHWDLIRDRRSQLENWVNAGGRIVLDRTLIGGDEHLASWAGIRREYLDDDDTESDTDTDQEAKDGEDDDAPEEPTGELCERLSAVDAQGQTLPTAREFSVCKLDGYSSLATDRTIAWGLAGTDGIQALRVTVGQGSVTSINAEPFGNRDLLHEDHPYLLVAAAQLHRGDRIIFISEAEHTSLLGLIWIHGAPVVVLFTIMVAFVLWRGGVRFGPLSAATETARRSIAEQIRGTGQFTIRLGGGKALHAASVRALHEAASRRLAGYAAMAQPDRVALLAQQTGIDVDALAQAINHGGARKPSDLAQQIATVETARRKILELRL